MSRLPDTTPIRGLWDLLRGHVIAPGDDGCDEARSFDVTFRHGCLVSGSEAHLMRQRRC